MKKISLILFLGVAIAQILGEYFEIRPLSAGFKLLLMPALILYYWSNVPISSSPTTHRGIMFALILSYFGDTFLLFAAKGELFFLIGLIFFLFAHVAYIFVFVQFSGIKNGFLKHHPLFIIPVILFYGILMWLLIPHIPSTLVYPVAIYGAVISTMLLSVINTFGGLSKKNFLTLLAGAILFVISDSILALVKFHPYIESGNMASVAVMATYIGGQTLLTGGTILYLTSPISKSPN